MNLLDESLYRHDATRGGPMVGGADYGSPSAMRYLSVQHGALGGEFAPSHE